MKEDSESKHHAIIRRTLLKTLQTQRPANEGKKDEQKWSLSPTPPGVPSGCVQGAGHLETCSRESIPSSAHAGAKSRSAVVRDAAEALPFVNAGSAKVRNFHSSTSSFCARACLPFSRTSSYLRRASTGPAPVPRFRRQNCNVRVHSASPSPKPLFQQHCASATFWLSRSLLPFSYRKYVEARSNNHAAELKYQAQSWLALGLQDFAEALAVFSEDEEEDDKAENGDGTGDEGTDEERVVNSRALQENVPDAGGTREILVARASRKTYTAAGQTVRKTKYPPIACETESHLQHDHARMRRKHSRNMCAWRDCPPRYFCSLWEVLEGSTLRHLVIQSKCKAFQFIHSRLAVGAASTNDEKVLVPTTGRQFLCKPVQPTLSLAEPILRVSEECTPGGCKCTSPDRKGNDQGNKPVTPESASSSFLTFDTQEVPDAEVKGYHPGGGTTHVFKVMVDFYLSIVYLLGDKLKRELDGKLLVCHYVPEEDGSGLKEEARSLKAQLRRMEAQTKEGLQKAGREIEEIEMQSGALVQEVAKLACPIFLRSLSQQEKLKTQERNQEELRQQYQQKLHRQRLQYEMELEEVSQQCTTLSRENDRKEHQIARLRACLQRSVQLSGETNALHLTGEGQRGLRTHPSDRTAPETLLRSSLFTRRSTTRTVEVDTKRIQNPSSTRRPIFQGFAENSVVEESGKVRSGSASACEISRRARKSAVLRGKTTAPQLQQCRSRSGRATGVVRSTSCGTGDSGGSPHHPDELRNLTANNLSCTACPTPTRPTSSTSYEAKRKGRTPNVLRESQTTAQAIKRVSFRPAASSKFTRRRLPNKVLAVGSATRPRTTPHADGIRTRPSSQSLHKELLDAICVGEYEKKVAVGRLNSGQGPQVPLSRRFVEGPSIGLVSGTVFAGKHCHASVATTGHDEITVAQPISLGEVGVLPVAIRRKKQPVASLSHVFLYTFLLVALVDISMLDNHLQAALFRSAQWVVLLALSGIQNLQRLQLPTQQEEFWHDNADDCTINSCSPLSEIALHVRVLMLSLTERALVLTLKALHVVQGGQADELEHLAHYAEVLTDQFSAVSATDLCANSHGFVNESSNLFKDYACH